MPNPLCRKTHVKRGGKCSSEAPFVLRLFPFAVNINAACMYAYLFRTVYVFVSSKPLVFLVTLVALMASLFETRHSILVATKPTISSSCTKQQSPCPPPCRAIFILLPSSGTRSCSAPLSRSTGGVPSSAFRWSSQRAPSASGLPFGWCGRPRGRRP